MNEPEPLAPWLDESEARSLRCDAQGCLAPATTVYFRSIGRLGPPGSRGPDDVEVRCACAAPEHDFISEIAYSIDLAELVDPDQGWSLHLSAKTWARAGLAALRDRLTNPWGLSEDPRGLLRLEDNPDGLP